MASSRITGTNENISTYGDGTRNYSALGTWESATDNDLVAATTSEVLECYADAASFDDSINMGGATTNSTYFRIIRAANGEGHTGIPATGVRFSYTGGLVAFAVESNAAIIDIDVLCTNNNVGQVIAIYTNAGTSNARVLNCLAKGVNSGGPARGIVFDGDGIAVNCLAYECTTTGFRLTGTETVSFYNCTAIGSGEWGWQAANAGSTTVLKNCLASGNSTGGMTLSGTTTGSTHNATSDATAIGTVNYQSQTFTFVNSASDDYHLHRNDLGAKFRGTNLSADGTFAFDDDIDGDTITYWPIGFHAEETVQSSWRTGDNENISTYAASGADYTALTVWEAATDIDLVTGAVTEVLECEAAIYDDTVSLAGATTDGRYFRIIRPAPGHEHGGQLGSGVAFEATTLTSNCVIQINENFSKVQGISLSTSTSSASANFGIQFGASCDYGEAVGCIADRIGNVGAGNGNGFGAATGSDRCRIANCLAVSCKTAGFTANGTSVNHVWTNNTSVGSPTGFTKAAGASVIAINNLADNNATAGYSGTYATGSTTNASEKADAPGTSNRDSQTFTFVNELIDDYHLKATDAGAKGFGTNLTTGNYFNYNDDVDLVTITIWSIGFDSDPSVGAHCKVNSIPLVSKVHGVLA